MDLSMREALNSSNILLCRESYGAQGSMSHKYVKKDIREYYFLTDEQTTIPKNRYGTYDGILNDDGLAELQRIKQLVDSDQFKDTFVKYRFSPSNSGPWIPNKNSPYHTSENNMMALNSWNDEILLGLNKYMIDLMPREKNLNEADVTWIKTSPILFFTDDWAYTKSGSLYKLKENLEKCWI